jgi:hypothetical protein
MDAKGKDKDYEFEDGDDQGSLLQMISPQAESSG